MNGKTTARPAPLVLPQIQPAPFLGVAGFVVVGDDPSFFLPSALHKLTSAVRPSHFASASTSLSLLSRSASPQSGHPPLHSSSAPPSATIALSDGSSAPDE